MPATPPPGRPVLVPIGRTLSARWSPRISLRAGVVEREGERLEAGRRRATPPGGRPRGAGPAAPRRPPRPGTRGCTARGPGARSPRRSGGARAGPRTASFWARSTARRCSASAVSARWSRKVDVGNTATASDAAHGGTAAHQPRSRPARRSPVATSAATRRPSSAVEVASTPSASIRRRSTPISPDRSRGRPGRRLPGRRRSRRARPRCAGAGCTWPPGRSGPGAPVLIWPQLVATARSAMVTSSVSPERCDITARVARRAWPCPTVVERLGERADLVDLHEDRVGHAAGRCPARGARRW